MKLVKFRKWSRFPDYQSTIDEMEGVVENIIHHKSNPELWFLEYDDVYTGGSGSEENDIKNPNINIIKTNRGGKYTYHGKGQRVIYFMIDLHDIFGEKPDLKKYIDILELWVIDSLMVFGIKSSISNVNRGVWCGMSKIAAIGIRLKKWIAYHGIAINVSTDLSAYENFIPCGLDGYGVTSIANEIRDFDHNDDLMARLDESLIENFEKNFAMKLII